MRRFVGLCAVAALLALAGCQAPTQAPELPDRPGNDPGMSETPALDPSEDVVGWENGVWYDDPIPIEDSDGLNDTELGLVVNRSMARVEHLRQGEFSRTVPVEVISRAEFADRVGGDGGNTSRDRAKRLFKNTIFEALFLIGEDESAIDRREENTQSSVLGYYAPAKNRITIVSDTDTVVIDERTLAHELVHAFQWEHYRMRRLGGWTIEKRNAGSAVIEGVARYLDGHYADRCGDVWDCVMPPSRDAGDPDDDTEDGNDAEDENDDGGEIHRGLYVLQYFPYSDGPVLVDRMRSEGGWDAVAGLYANPPESTEQVIDPDEYRSDTPANITVTNRSDEEWTRIQPPRGGPMFESVGQPGLTAMFAYPAYDDRRSDPVLPKSAFMNREDGTPNRTDPFEYDAVPVSGWDGDRMYVYANASNATGYVWRLAWDSAADAREFADAYRRLLRYWGGERSDGVWRIPEEESGFGDAFAIEVDGSTVTIVNGPTAEDLDGIHGPVASRESD
ncbi:MAG: Hvo_1808 family surface protein [Halobacteriales archaeon]